MKHLLNIGPQGELLFIERRFNPDQPRDADGKFGSGDDKPAREEFALAGKTCDGLTVGDKIPNQDSIGASLDSYKVREGVREIPMKGWIGTPGRGYANAAENERCKALAEQIKESGRIDPLIVGVDPKGEPYIIEGGHRLEALGILGKNAFPALVVDDTSEERSLRFNPDQPRDKDGKFTMGNVASFKNEEDGVSAHVTSYNGRLHVTLVDDDSNNVVSSSIYSGEGMKEKALAQAQKMAGVKSKEKRFDEDQPREADGKFASTGSAKEMISMEMDNHEMMSVVVRNRARELNFPLDRLTTVNGQGKEFAIAGTAYKEAGHATLTGENAGHVTIFTEGLSHIGVGGLVAHEVEHVRFQEVLNDYHGEMQHLSNLATHDHETYDSITTPNGYLDSQKGAYAVFPVATTLEPYLSRNGEQLAKEDGVTAYSRSYWDGYTKGTVARDIAIHETLAEMARLKYEEKANNMPDNPFGALIKTEKPTALWKGLFKEVNSIAKERGYGYTKKGKK